MLPPTICNPQCREFLLPEVCKYDAATTELKGELMQRRWTRSLTAASAALAIVIASVGIAIPSAADDELDEISNTDLAPLALDGENCVEAPYGGQDVFLRGDFNSWSPAADFRFTYNCDR